MNLGDTNLKTVNSNRPQLLHALSEQSIAASDHYYSFSDHSSEHASDGPSIGSLVTVVRYETPPSHARSLASSPEKRLPEELLSVKIQDCPPTESSATPETIDEAEPRLDEDVSDGRRAITAQDPRNDELGAPTPGVDDTPYIRFAIDQLTRDEELTGTRREGFGGSEASYPVDRIVPDNGLGYIHRDAKPPPRKGQLPSGSTGASKKPGVFIPVDTPVNSLRYPDLTYLPGVLRPFPLILLVFCCLLLIGGLLFCNIWSIRYNGLWDYDGVGTGRYFVFQYLPQILASIVVIWLFVLQTALCRILPFMTLASRRSKEQSGALYDMSLFPTTFVLPDITLFRLRQPLLGSCVMVFWLSIFTIPLQASAFQTRLVNIGGRDIWRWTAVQPVVWTVIALYGVQVTALLTLLVCYIFKRCTGLQWDITSLADLMVLLRRSNILHEYEGSDILEDIRSTRVSGQYRLGYWRLSNTPGEIFYSLGLENEPIRDFDSRHGSQKPTNRKSTGFDVEAQRPLRSSVETDMYSPAVRYRWTPWFLRETFLVAWIVTAVVLVIAFIAVSFIRHAIRDGFLPLLPSSTNSAGFSPADFSYSFIPSLIGLILFLLWQPIDTYFRALQPFANLASPAGALAEDSLLLKNTSCYPLLVSIRAAIAGHYNVAWFSFISLLSITLPILGGGIFTAQYFPSNGEVRMTAHMPAFYALVAFVIFYTLSFSFIWPTWRRRLPHGIKTLAELISFVHRSPLLGSAAFDAPATKTDLVTRLLSTPAEEKMRSRYGFGMYRGTDGREHLGIDRLRGQVQ